jgi:hypothetical protein
MTESYEAMDLDKEAQPPVITATMGPDRTTVMFASSMRKFVQLRQQNFEETVRQGHPIGCRPSLFLFSTHLLTLAKTSYGPFLFTLNTFVSLVVSYHSYYS